MQRLLYLKSKVTTGFHIWILPPFALSVLLKLGIFELSGIDGLVRIFETITDGDLFSGGRSQENHNKRPNGCDIQTQNRTYPKGKGGKKGGNKGDNPQRVQNSSLKGFKGGGKGKSKGKNTGE